MQLFLAGRQVVAVLIRDGQLLLDKLELSHDTLASLRAYAKILIFNNSSSLEKRDPNALGWTPAISCHRDYSSKRLMLRHYSYHLMQR